MRRSLRWCLVLLTALGPTAATAEDDADVCAGSADYLARERACDRIILGGEYSGADLAWAYANRCKALHNLGQSEAAVLDCSFALSLKPRIWQAYDNRAIANQKLGRYEEALSDIDEAMALHPGNFAGHVTRANVLCSLGRTREALASYDRAMAHNVLPAFEWQGFLKERGFYRGAVDGKFGPQSRNALYAWARAHCKPG